MERNEQNKRELRSRFSELEASRRLSIKNLEEMKESLLRATSREDLEAILPRIISTAIRSGMVRTDCAWVMALGRTGTPIEHVLKVWNERDQILHSARDGTFDNIGPENTPD